MRGDGGGSNIGGVRSPRAIPSVKLGPPKFGGTLRMNPDVQLRNHHDKPRVNVGGFFVVRGGGFFP